MKLVNLIESVRQVKNHVEIVATVQDINTPSYLGITDFFLLSTEQLPEDEDELCDFLETKKLDWDLYIPHYDPVDKSIDY